MEKIRIDGVRRLLLAVVFCLVQVSTAFAGQIIIDSDDQLDYARTLMENKEFDRAVGEFERFIYFFPQDPQVPEARYLVGLCYLKGAQYEVARDKFSRIVQSDPGGAFAGKALFMMGESYYRQGIMKEAENYFIQVIERYPDPVLKNSAFYRLGWTRMQKEKWQEASEIFGRVEKESDLYGKSRHLAQESLKGETLPYKSPTEAGILAAIIPGLGHAYVSRYKDATIAFLLNGLFIWAAVEAFDNDNNVLGGILTFFELGWYSGNIYSAVNVTHKHNKNLRNKFLGQLDDRLNLRPFVTGKGQFGLALTFQF